MPSGRRAKGQRKKGAEQGSRESESRNAHTATVEARQLSHRVDRLEGTRNVFGARFEVSWHSFKEGNFMI